MIGGWDKGKCSIRWGVCQYPMLNNYPQLFWSGLNWPRRDPLSVAGPAAGPTFGIGRGPVGRKGEVSLAVPMDLGAAATGTGDKVRSHFISPSRTEGYSWRPRVGETTVPSRQTAEMGKRVKIALMPPDASHCWETLVSCQSSTRGVQPVRIERARIGKRFFMFMSKIPPNHRLVQAPVPTRSARRGRSNRRTRWNKQGMGGNSRGRSRSREPRFLLLARDSHTTDKDRGRRRKDTRPNRGEAGHK